MAPRARSQPCTKEIGARLYIAEKTVENHSRNILGKLDPSRRQQLIRQVLDGGIDLTRAVTPRATATTT